MHESQTTQSELENNKYIQSCQHFPLCSRAVAPLEGCCFLHVIDNRQLL